MIYGIDVSSHQPEQFPLELPDGTPVEFVMIKVTQGGAYTNPKWKAQAAWARQHGLAVGFYHFGEAGNQAVHAGRFLGILGALYPGETLWYDWEDLYDADSVSAPTNAEKDAFILEVKRLRPGRKVGLYCNVDFWKNWDTTGYCGDALWIASWSDPIATPPIVAPWIIHQYSDGGGKLDHNRANFGHREDMKVWGGKPPSDTEIIARAVADLIRKVSDLHTKFDRYAAQGDARFDSLKGTLDSLVADVAALGPENPDILATHVVEEMGRRFLSS